jgi:hypothetical protein
METMDGEYMRAPRKRRNLTHQGKNKTATVGGVVLIKNDNRNRGKWNIGIVTKLIKGRDE